MLPLSPRQLVQESKDAKEGTDAAARKAGQTSFWEFLTILPLCAFPPLEQDDYLNNSDAQQEFAAQNLTP